MRLGFSTVGRGCALWKSTLLPEAVSYDSVDKGRHSAVTNRVARHSMSEDRAPSDGVHFASKTNPQMSSGTGLRRLYYKAFAEAKPPARISTGKEDHGNRFRCICCNRLGRPETCLDASGTWVSDA